MRPHGTRHGCRQTGATARVTPAPDLPTDAAAGWLTGGRELGALIRAQDWAANPLGPSATWREQLRTAVGIALRGRFPMIVWWGPELRLLSNDDHVPILAEKHPGALGRSGHDVWWDGWDVVGPMLDSVVRTGQATRADDLQLIRKRRGYKEEGFFDFSYSPIGAGAVVGIFTPSPRRPTA